MAFAETFVVNTRMVVDQDGDGNDVYDSVTSNVRGAFAPAGSSELIQGQATVLAHDTLYLEAGSPVPKPTDTMTVRGAERQIDGVPEEYVNPFTGWRPGPVVRLLKVTG